MNLRVKVWLPPDGDPRLVRLQQAAAESLGCPGRVGVPPYLDLGPGGIRPEGSVETGAWGIDKAELVLEARDSAGPVGLFRFGLAVGGPNPSGQLDRLPAAPCWKWTRGRTGILAVETAAGPGTVILWTWESLSGWKPDRPKG